MATTSRQQLRSSFLFSGLAGAITLAVGIAVAGSQNARGTLDRLANARGREVAARAATLASTYMRERRHETEVLARTPAVRPAAPRPVGVRPPAFPLDRLVPLPAAPDLGDGPYLGLVDDRGRVTATPNRAELLQPLRDEQAIPRQDRPSTMILKTAHGPELV